MPLTEVVPSGNNRRTTLYSVHAPFVVVTLVVSFAALLTVPEVFFSGAFLTGLGIILVSNLAGLLVPWDRIPHSVGIIPSVLDLAGVSLLQLAAYEQLPAIGVLAVFPAVWLAYAFHGRVISFIVWGLTVLVALPLVTLGPAPDSPRAWVNVLILPVALILIVSAVRAAAAQVRRNRATLDRISALQVEALRAAQDSELVLRSVFDTVDAAMAFYGVNNRPVMANEAAYATVSKLGFSLEHPPFAGEHVYRTDRVTPIPFEEQIIPRALSGERIANHVEWLGPPGDQAAIMASAQQVHRPDGELLGTVIAVYDITELANAITVREEFLRTVSHELRTPLTSIIGYLEVMEDSVDMEQVGLAGYMEIVQRNAAELHTRVAQLLAFADDTPESSFPVTDASDVTSAVVQHYLPIASARGLTLTWDIEPSILATADTGKVRQVSDHLISNAVKYTGRGGSIHVALAVEDRHAVMTVADTGRGMTPEQQRQAFDRFFRAPEVRSDAVQGLGIGLSLVKQIVEANSGTIGIASEPGVGTTVTIRIPYDREAMALQERAVDSSGAS